MVFVTSNRGKAREVRKIVKKIRLIVKPLLLNEDYSLSHEKLAVGKAKHAFAILQKPVIVEDTILLVSGFKDYPGLKTKEVYQELGLEGFVKKCGGRNASFTTIAVYYDGKKARVFKGVCRGRISKHVGKETIGGLPFLRVFILPKHRQVISEIPKKEFDEFFSKNNHRAEAFGKFEKWFLRSAG